MLVPYFFSQIQRSTIITNCMHASAGGDDSRGRTRFCIGVQEEGVLSERNAWHRSQLEQLQQQRGGLVQGKQGSLLQVRTPHPLQIVSTHVHAHG